MRKAILAAAVLGGIALLAGKAGAASSISYSYVTDQSTYSGAVGSPVTVLVYLKETLGGGATSLIDSDGGLLGAGFSVRQASGAAGVYSILGSTTANGQNFPGGTSTEKAGDPANNTFASVRTILEGTSNTATSGPMTGNSAVTGMIEIGSVTIEGTTVGASTFTLGNYLFPASTGGKTQTTNSDFDLDNSASGGTPDPANVTTAGGAAGAETFTFNATAAPEPASLAMFGLGSVGLLARRRRLARVALFG